MEKPAKKSRIPQLGFSTPNRPLAPATRIPLGGNLLFSSASQSQSTTIQTATLTTNKNNQPTIYQSQQHPKVFTSKVNNAPPIITTTITSPTTVQQRPSIKPLQALNSSLNSTIAFDNVLNSTFRNESLSDESSSSSLLNCTVIRNKPALRQNLYKKHIGDKVVVGGTETGTLKFVGPVQFDRGIWCGIELSNPVGKHDGMVKDVRYFECRKNHGILAPICKVDIATDAKSNFEKLKSKFEWYASKFPTSTIKFNKKSLTPLQRNIQSSISNETVILGLENNCESSSGPYSLIGISSSCAIPSMKDESVIETNTPIIDQDDSQATTIPSDKLNLRRSTYTIHTEVDSDDIQSDNVSNHEAVVLNETYPLISTDSLSEECNAPDNEEDVNKTIILHDWKSEPIISSITFNRESPFSGSNRTFVPLLKETASTGHLPLETESQRKTSLDYTYEKCEADDSLGILTPNQMCIVKTPSTDDLHDVLSQWTHFDKNKSEINSRNIELKGEALKAPISALTVSSANECVALSSKTTVNKSIPIFKKPLPTSPLTLDSNSYTKRTNSLTSGHVNKKSPILSSPNTIVSFGSQNSFECDESLGILTPNQMCEFPKTSSSDELRSVLSEWRRFDKSKFDTNHIKEERLKLPSSLTTAENFNQLETESYETFINRPLQSSEILLSPNVPDSFAADISLEILNDDIMNATHFLTDNSISNLDTTINMDLPLDPDFEKGNLKQVLRCEQTPSPEELPLDPIEVKIETGESISNNHNTESESKTKSVTKTFNSFVMSVTSITSLDNGYQGDGEMSRPASRGGDHSPTVHKPSNQCLAAAINNQWQRAAVSRRPDPMTDSDFFTESDADGHDENAPKGDRKVQVIDGQLYGLNALNPQPAGEEIFVNNQNRVGEEMDSSGIFTDLDTNTRNDELSDVERNRSGNEEKPRNEEDQTPSDVSSKTISENSQERHNENNESIQNISQIDNTLSEHISNLENSLSSPESKSLPGSCQSSPSKKSISSPKFLKTKEDPSSKKCYKMPRRNVVSKVKTMLEKPKTNNIENQENRKPSKKIGKWDAVMSKITDSKPKLKEVKSKVSCGLIGSGNDNRGSMISKTSNSNITNNFQQTNTNPKFKRRTRTLKSNEAQTESIHSSLSDISNSGSLPVRSLSETSNLQTFNRSAKKALTTANSRCTSPPNSGDTVASPRYQGVSPSAGSHRISRSGGSKKSPPLTTPLRPPTSNEATSKRFSRQSRVLFNGAGAKNTTTSNSIVSNLNSINNKDSTRLTGAPIAKARCVAAVQTVPESQPTPEINFIPQLQHAALSVEALGVLLQHLVFHYDAFKVPLLKKDYEHLKEDWTKIKLELDETRIGYRRVKDLLEDERLKNETCQEKENSKNLQRINEIQEAHRLAIIELSEKYTIERHKTEQRLREQFIEEKNKYTNQIENLCKENERWKTDFNDLKTKYDENLLLSDQVNKNFLNIEKEYKLKLEKANDQRNSLHEEFKQKESDLNQKILSSEARILVLEEEAKKVVDVFKAETKETRLQALNRCMLQLKDETESLRVVLDLKQKECADLRKKYQEVKRDADRDADLLSSTLVNAQILQTRVEDLEIQLQRKIESEKQLVYENKRLNESFLQESEKKQRISFQNEELQWKLKQNSEVVSVLLSEMHTPSKILMHGSNQSLNEDHLLRSPRACLARSFQTSSFNEKHASTPTTQNNIYNRDTFSTPKNNYSKIDRKPPSEQKEENTDAQPDISYVMVEEISPPSSPKIKAVVEKCDSVSYVIEIDESPEVLANRMYRRSFRNSTPPKNTPTKSPSLKRCKRKTNHPLSLSASETSIGSENRDDDLRSRSKSMSAKKTTVSEKGRSDADDEEEDNECYAYCLKATTEGNHILDFRQNVKCVELGPSEITYESLAEDLIIDSDIKNEHFDEYNDGSVHMSLPALPSELQRSQCQTDKKISGEHLPAHLSQNSFPKNAAGEALISESNSDDECSSSVSSERSHSLSDVDPTDNLAKSAAKTSQMHYDLMLVTESTISENMDCNSWSDE